MKKYLKTFLLILIFIISLSFGQKNIFAQFVEADVANMGDLPDAEASGNKDMKGTEVLKKILLDDEKGILFYIKVIIGIVSSLYLVIMIANVIIARGDETEIEKSKNAILYIILGFFILMLGDKFYEIFDLTGETESGNVAGNNFIANPGATISNFQNSAYAPVFLYARNIVSIVAIFFIIISGWKMITAQGDDSAYQKEKNKLIYSIIAIIIIIMSEVLMLTFVGVGYENGNINPNISQGIVIIASIINFILTIVGVIAVAYLILGGFYYIRNVHGEKTAEQGKAIVVNTIIALVIIFSAKVIVNFAIGLDKSQSNGTGGVEYVGK